MKVLLCLLASLSVALAEKPRLGGAVEMTAAELADPALLEIANFAVSRIDEWTNGMYRSKLVQVLSGTRQLVAGYKYTLEIETAMTTCSKMGMITLESCPLHPDFTNQLCHVEVYVVPWTGEREVLAQGCRQKPTKRQFTFGGLPGGLNQADTTDEAVMAAALFAVDEFNAQSNALYLNKLLHVHNAQTQVVNGINYHLRLEIGTTVCAKGDNQLLADCEFDSNAQFQVCDVVVYNRWDDHKEVTRMSCRSTRSRRQLMPGGLAGGVNPTDPNSQSVLEMSAFAVDTINAQSNSMYLSKLVQVHSASTQVVAGINYHLELEIGATSCYKGDSVSLEDCDIDQNGRVEICMVIVFDQPWTNTREVRSMTCRPKAVAKRQLGLAGGLMAADVNHQDIQRMALLSVDHVNAMRNNPTLSKLVEVTSAQYQVVAGLKYYLTMEIGTTVCSSSDNTVLLSDCDVLLGGGRETCDVQVLDQPWIGEPQVLSFSCTPKPFRP
ncbi:KNG1 [Branchiostoma lanceolatum]|uniref:KNG1 protein n=1 Tax=Branchiostoma lanceolatum TaxID=7740 RepID=A0A8J9ZSH6_BRALA|nr:KNG1 [Branchiostoma lanceolatum]